MFLATRLPAKQGYHNFHRCLALMPCRFLRAGFCITSHIGERSHDERRSFSQLKTDDNDGRRATLCVWLGTLASGQCVRSKCAWGKIAPRTAQRQAGRKMATRKCRDNLPNHAEAVGALPQMRPPAGLNNITHLIWPESAPPLLHGALKRGSQRHRSSASRSCHSDHRLQFALKPFRKTVQRTIKGSSSTACSRLMAMPGSPRYMTKNTLFRLANTCLFKPSYRPLACATWSRSVGALKTGQKPRLIKLPKTPPFAPLICYEVVFPEEICRTW